MCDCNYTDGNVVVFFIGFSIFLFCSIYQTNTLSLKCLEYHQVPEQDDYKITGKMKSLGKPSVWG